MSGKGESAMTEPLLNRKQIEELLRETDCPAEFARQFLAAVETETTEEQLRMLRCQRCRLLERIHDERRKLDGLDYLRYCLEKGRDRDE